MCYITLCTFHTSIMVLLKGVRVIKWGLLFKGVHSFHDCMVWLQKLEETCEQVRRDKSLSTLQKEESGSAYIPMRIRDIIQETLSPAVWSGQPFLASSLSRENSKLLQELDKAQELLSQSRKECHDLGVKFITVSEKASKQANF